MTIETAIANFRSIVDNAKVGAAYTPEITEAETVTFRGQAKRPLTQAFPNRHVNDPELS